MGSELTRPGEARTNEKKRVMRGADKGVRVVALLTALLGLAACTAAPSPLTVSFEADRGVQDGMATDVMYWVPLSAPIEAMTLGSSTTAACSPDLTSWLESHASLLTTPQAVLLRSSAAEEQTLTLRAEGSFGDPEPGFLLQCGTPAISDTATQPGELAWQLALLRFEGDEVELLEATEEGPRPLSLAITRDAPIGLLALLQGDRAFTGKLLVSTPGTASVPLPFLATGDPASTDLHWPGIPSAGTLRVAVAEDAESGEVAFLCSLASQSAWAASPCDPSTGPTEEQIRQQAVRYRDNYERARDREPPPEVAPGSQTAITRLDPWADASLAEKEISSSADGCSRDSYRPDRIDCSASLTCYLNADESLGACHVLDEWEVFEVGGIQELPPDPDAPMDVEMLRLTDGTLCRFHTGAGPFPPEGFDGWVGSCKDGTEVLWGERRDAMPLDQAFLFEPARAGGYLRVAAGPENTDPTYYDVAEIFY